MNHKKYISIVTQGSGMIAFEMLYFMVIYVWLFIWKEQVWEKEYNDLFLKNENSPPILPLQYVCGSRQKLGLRKESPWHNRDQSDINQSSEQEVLCVLTGSPETVKTNRASIFHLMLYSFHCLHARPGRIRPLPLDTPILLQEKP